MKNSEKKSKKVVPATPEKNIVVVYENYDATGSKISLYIPVKP